MTLLKNYFILSCFAETQTDIGEKIASPVREFTSVHTQTDSESSESSDLQSEEDNQPVSEYEASSSDSGSTDSMDLEDEPSLLGTRDKEMGKTLHKEKKFIVFLSALLRLLTWQGSKIRIESW